MAVQVTLRMDNAATFDREVSALDKFIAVNPQYKGIIVTLDEERSIKSSTGLDIDIIPIWKWVLL